MKTPLLGRAACAAVPRSSRLGIFLLGATVSLVPALLIVVVGLVVQVLVSRSGGSLSDHSLLGIFFRTRWTASWPWFGTFEWCLIAVVGAGLAIWVFGWLIRGLGRRTVQVTASVATRELRHSVLRHTVELGPFAPMRDNRSSPEELFFVDVESIRDGLVARWWELPRAVLSIGFLLILAGFVNVWLTLLFVLLAVAVWQHYDGLRQRSRVAAQRHAQQAEQESLALRSHLSVPPTTAVLSGDERCNPALERKLARYEALRINADTAERRLRFFLSFVTGLAALFLLLIVGLAPQMNVPSAVMVTLAFVGTYLPFQQFRRANVAVAKGEEAATTIFAYLDQQPQVVQHAAAEPLGPVSRVIRFDNVTLNDRPKWHSLENISLLIPAGLRVAIMSTDATIFDVIGGLFARLTDPASGRLMFDELDLRHVTLDSVRQQTALVAEAGVIIAGTVSGNIACGDARFSSYEIVDAAKRSGAYEFISQLPQGFATIIGEGGTELTPGQCFLLASARVLLRDPSVIVVKEPELGPEHLSEAALDELLTTLSCGRTMLVNAVRISTLRSADRVFLFHDGKLKGQGTHAHLVQTNDLYRHLNYIRFNSHRNTA